MRPPEGLERIFVMLTERPERSVDLKRLFETSLLARADAKGLADRDIQVQQIEQGREDRGRGERPYAVYAVARPPQLFVEIALRHE
jgi:hypothetical protein